MTSWVALLRGVNVNGVTIRNADLAAVFRDEGHADVVTVLASGNGRFRAQAEAADRSALKASIEAALRRRFDYDAWIVLVTLDELAAALEGFPFDAADADRQPYVIFCADAGVRDALMDAAATVDPAEDPNGAGFGFVYWSPVKGHTVDSPFGKIVAKAAYRQTTTTRNLRTLAKIVG